MLVAPWALPLLPVPVVSQELQRIKVRAVYKVLAVYQDLKDLKAHVEYTE